MFHLNRLKYTYPNSEFLLEMNEVKFDEQEIVAFIGSNGCGKTTFYRTLSGILTPNEMALSVDGAPFHSLLESPIKIGAHNAFAELQGNLTVLQNLNLVAAFHGLAKNGESIERVASKVGLENLLGRYPKELSAGQQHRVKLARTLIHDPDVVLLDEPTTASDLKNIEIILQLIESLRSQGKLVFISTHHLYELALLKPRLVGIQNGKIAFDDPWDSDYEKSEVLQLKMKRLIDGK